MSPNPFVASEGPVLPGLQPGLVSVGGIASAQNAAPVAPAAAATAEIFAAGERLRIITTLANESFRASLNVERDNAGAAGNGTYRLLVDGVPVGPTRIGPTGQAEQGLTILDCVLSIALAGTHIISAQVTSNGDVETVLAGARLNVEAAQFTTNI